MLRRAHELSPLDPRPPSNLGTLLVHLRRDAEARKILEEVLSDWPAHIQARRSLARMTARRGDLEEARAVLARGARLAGSHPDVPPLLRDLAVIDRRLGKKREAEAAEKAAGALERRWK